MAADSNLLLHPENEDEEEEAGPGAGAEGEQTPRRAGYKPVQRKGAGRWGEQEAAAI